MLMESKTLVEASEVLMKEREVGRRNNCEENVMTVVIQSIGLDDRTFISIIEVSADGCFPSPSISGQASRCNAIWTAKTC